MGFCPHRHLDLPFVNSSEMAANLVQVIGLRFSENVHNAVTTLPGLSTLWIDSIIL
jgi:hypothetical protein